MAITFLSSAQLRFPAVSVWCCRTIKNKGTFRCIDMYQKCFIGGKKGKNYNHLKVSNY